MTSIYIPVAIFTGVTSLLAYRIFVVLHTSKKQTPMRRDPGDTCSLSVFLGSGMTCHPPQSSQTKTLVRLGGHTTEALALLSEINFARYRPRIYIIGEGDFLSAQKAHALELSKRETEADSVS